MQAFHALASPRAGLLFTNLAFVQYPNCTAVQTSIAELGIEGQNAIRYHCTSTGPR